MTTGKTTALTRWTVVGKVMSLLFNMLSRLVSTFGDLYNQEIQEKEKDLQNQPQTIQKIATGTHRSIITLNVNGLNAPTKRHRLDEWIQNQDPYICSLQDIHLKTGDTYRLKVKGWKNIF